MEWNPKPPLQWEWENLIIENTQSSDNAKRFRPTNLAIDIGGINSEPIYSLEVGDGTVDSGSDLLMAFSAKSSASASINSSATGELKSPKFSFEASEYIPEDYGSNKVCGKVNTTGNSPMLEASTGAGEPLLGLKLGKRTYFEDVCAGGNVKASSQSVIPTSSVTPVKRSKASWQSTLDLYCQVEGCKLELSSAKDYHRKHRICETHSKCTKVIVNGLERRFCQQCSRFHGLSEFDGKKRSCRKRLSNHNARRRKPQKETMGLHPMKLSLLSFNGGQQISPIWGSNPLVHTGSNAYFTWGSTNDTKFVQTSEFLSKHANEGNMYRQHLSNDELPNSSIVTFCHDSSNIVPSKATKSEFLNQDLESINISALDETPDFHRALSLLSKNTWGSCDPKAILPHPLSTNHANLSSPVMPTIQQGLPFASSEDWHNKPQSTKSQSHSSSSHGYDSSNFQEFQLVRMPYESGFYSSQLT